MWRPHAKQVIDELGIPFVLANPRTGKFELWGNLDEPEREQVLPEKGVIELGAATLRFRHYTSDDGTNWTRDETRDLAYDARQRGEVCGLTPGPAVVIRGDGDKQRREMYYGAWGKNRVPAGSSFPCVWAINRAVLERE